MLPGEILSTLSNSLLAFLIQFSAPTLKSLIMTLCDMSAHRSLRQKNAAPKGGI